MTCQQNNIPIHYDLLDRFPQFSHHLKNYDLIIDAIFGFSYRPPLRGNYKIVIESLKEVEKNVVAIDIPSGWHVENGNIDALFNPG
jgi:NAD(P)H-hydrate epimerase